MKVFPKVSNLTLAVEVMASIWGVFFCGETHTLHIFFTLRMIWRCMLKFSRNFYMEFDTKEKSVSMSGKRVRLSKWCEI